MTALAEARVRIVAESVRMPEDRVAAMRDYVLLRHEGLTENDALGKMLLTWADTVDWCRRDKWEACFRAVEGSRLLASDALRADLRIKDVMLRKMQVEDIVNRLYEKATLPGEGAASAAAQYMRYARQLDETLDRLESEVSKSAQRFSELSALPVWRNHRADVLAGLHESYHGKGAQYDLLCTRLASVTVMIDQLEDSPTSIDPSQYEKLVTAQTHLINQLQKFTEATKSETIRSEVQEAIVRMMVIVEHHVAPTYPQLWNTITQDVIQRAGGGEIVEHAAPVARRSPRSG